MMPGWIETYLGLVFQIYGLAFFVLGVAALLSMRRDSGTGLAAHLGWLATFGMLHGLQEFIDGERLHNPAAWLAVLGTTLMVVSFAALLEFGRRLWNERPGGLRLAARPLYAAAGLGSAAFMLSAPAASAGLELGARYLLGAPGAALAGIGLLAQARSMARAPDAVVFTRWMRVSAVTMFGYATLTLFLSPDSGRLLSGWLPTTADFLAATGLPVQVARALCAALLAVGFVIISQRSGSLTAESLRRVTDRLDGFVYRCRNDRDWSMAFMSEGGETLTGYPAADFLRGDRHFAEQIHPDDRERAWDEAQAALAARRDIRLRFRIIDRAGTVRWCYEEGRGVFDPQGKLLYLEGLVRNDEARHHAEQSLQRERDFAKSLLDTAPVIILLMDPQGMIRHVNPWFEQLTGYRLDEIEGKEWFATFLPTRDQAHIRDLFANALHDQPVRGNINPIVTRDGEERAIEWHAMPLRDADGEMTGLLSIGMDVTERQRLEHELLDLNRSLEQRVVERTAEVERELQRNAAILGTAIDGFFAADATGRIHQANPAFCAMLGYGESELPGMHLTDLEALETPEQIAAHIEKVIAQGHDRFDTRHRCKDGSMIEVEISVSRVTLGDQTMFYAFARDISPRKAAEDMLRQARDEANRASAAKSEFLSRMSHELRTPLNAILGFAQVLRLPGEQPLSPQQADHVHEILNAGKHLLSLVNEVLDLARIESGRLEVKLEPVALHPVIKHCATHIEHAARERGIQPTLRLHSACTVLADPLRLQQVLLNLLSNAVKYNREGGRLEIECAQAPQQKRVRVSVRDTGRGLNAEQMARLFQPFERLESAYEGVEGTGIGLALAKQLVEGMQGTIGVDSEPGEGSSFWFELPLYSESLHANTPAATSITAASACTGEQKVLYVEDNPANFRLVQKILSKRPDIELLAAKNAEEGLMLAGREHPDLILLDLNLPDMDGFDLLRCLRNDPATRNTPVIAVTANAMKRDIERGKTAGFQDYLIKPINVQDFLSSIAPYVTAVKDGS